MGKIPCKHTNVTLREFGVMHMPHQIVDGVWIGKDEIAGDILEMINVTCNLCGLEKRVNRYSKKIPQWIKDADYLVRIDIKD